MISFKEIVAAYLNIFLILEKNTVSQNCQVSKQLHLNFYRGQLISLPFNMDFLMDYVKCVY